MIRCRTCVYPSTKPDLHFDESGQCSACTSHEKRPTIDWAERKAQLLALLDRHNGVCIVPSSGGKDSHYQVITLLEFGVKPVVVTASTCYLTDMGRKNIDNLARYATTMEITPNRIHRAKLNRLGLEMVGDISWPEHAAIFSIPFRVAVDLGCTLMFYGENPQNQYGGPPGTEDAKVMTRRWVSEFGGFLGLRSADMRLMVESMSELYDPPPEESIDRVGVEAHFLGQYLPWDSHQNAHVAMDHGMLATLPSKASWWPWENLDNAMTGIHDYFGFLKYGFGRLAAQISVDIRHGRITRDEAMSVVAERDGLFPLTYMGVPLARVLHHIGMSSEQFIETANSFMNPGLFVEPRVQWGKHLTLREFA